jgi:hypothetical protein
MTILRRDGAEGLIRTSLVHRLVHKNADER